MGCVFVAFFRADDPNMHPGIILVCWSDFNATSKVADCLLHPALLLTENSTDKPGLRSCWIEFDCLGIIRRCGIQINHEHLEISPVSVSAGGFWIEFDCVIE